MRNIFTLLLVALLSFTGCSQDTKNVTEETLYIRHLKGECYSFDLSLCLQTRNEVEADWQYLYSPIEGFQYSWGHTYQIKVRITEVDNPLEDGSSFEYKLLEILEATPISSTELFDISASRSMTAHLLTKRTDNLYSIYNEKDLTCEPMDCATIDSLISQDLAILFEVHHQIIPLDHSYSPKSNAAPAVMCFENLAYKDTIIKFL